MPNFSARMYQIFGWGSAPDPALEFTALPGPPSWWGGAGCLLRKNPTRCRSFGPRSWLCSSENFFLKALDKEDYNKLRLALESCTWVGMTGNPPNSAEIPRQWKPSLRSSFGYGGKCCGTPTTTGKKSRRIPVEMITHFTAILQYSAYNGKKNPPKTFSVIITQ